MGKKKVLKAAKKFKKNLTRFIPGPPVLTPFRLVIVSDIHAGSSCAPWPEDYELPEKFTYRSRPEALHYPTACWDHFWKQWVPSIVGSDGYTLVVNGDTTEGVHHHETMLMRPSASIHVDAAIHLLRDPVKNADRYFQVKGTSVHVGPDAFNEEVIARELKAVKDQETGCWSRYELWLQKYGRLFHATHHIGMGSPTTDFNSLQMHLVRYRIEHTRAGWPTPNIMARGHRHRHAWVRLDDEACLVTPSWKLLGGYEYYKVPYVTPQLGGAIVTIQPDGEFDCQMKIYKPDPPKIVALDGQSLITGPKSPSIIRL